MGHLKSTDPEYKKMIRGTYVILDTILGEKLKLLYKQIPYDNRYFFGYLNDREIFCIPMYIYESYGDIIFPPIFDKEDKRYQHWLKAVKAFNGYLDRKLKND